MSRTLVYTCLALGAWLPTTSYADPKEPATQKPATEEASTTEEANTGEEAPAQESLAQPVPPSEESTADPQTKDKEPAEAPKAATKKDKKAAAAKVKKSSPHYHRHDDYALTDHGHEQVPFVGHQFKMAFAGYIRASFATLLPDRFLFFKMPSSEESRNNPYVGRNDGFGLADARLNFRGTYQALSFRLGFDGALVSYGDSQDTEGSFESGIKDAYFRYTFHRASILSVGRFKPPFEMESLTATADQMFVRRSLESRGVLRHEGFGDDLPGFQQRRQLGLMVASPNVLEHDRFSAGYALALTNGNSGAPFNDNDLPAVYLRLHGGMLLADQKATTDLEDEEGPASYSLQNGVHFGLSGFINELTFGDPPNRSRDLAWAAAADLSVRWYLLTFQGQFIYGRTEHLTFDNAAPEAAMGGHAQVAVTLPGIGISPAFRFAYYDPRIPETTGISIDDDAVMHFTAGVRWALQSLPIITYLEFTHSAEEGGRSIPNDRIELAVQVTFE